MAINYGANLFNQIGKTQTSGSSSNPTTKTTTTTTPKTTSNFSNLANKILSNANNQASNNTTYSMANVKNNYNNGAFGNGTTKQVTTPSTTSISGGTKENPTGLERMLYSENQDNKGVNTPIPTKNQTWLRDYLKASQEEQENNDPVYYGGSGSGSGSGSSYYDDLMAAFMEQNEAARQASLEAILQNLNAVKGTYKNQIEKVINDYNALVDENEVKKDRARRVIRENQANRGQLDSGMGRQEQLDMNIGYDNATMDLKSAREQAVNEIYNLIAQAEAEANTNRANVNNTYNNALLEYQLATRS